MEMTIDRAVKKLKGQQADFNEQYIDFGGINDAFNTAYEVMRKYQKIEGIVRNYYNEQYTDKIDIEIIEMISEVLCDGNDD